MAELKSLREFAKFAKNPHGFLKAAPLQTEEAGQITAFFQPCGAVVFGIGGTILSTKQW
jgi:hypothetical protein